jgi:hypothetical protein
MDGTLGTTNALLAILAAVAVLEVFALIAASVVGWIIFRHLRDLMQEVRQQVPRLAQRVDVLAAQVQDVLVDVKDVSSRTAATAERVHHGFDAAADVASMAVSSAHMVFGRKASIATGIVRGLGVAYRILMQNKPRRPQSRSEPPDAGERARAAAGQHDDSATLKEATHGN